MKLTTIALIIGGFVLLLGLLGLISGEGRMMAEMNIDFPLDVVRIALGAFLIYAGRKSADLSKTAVLVFGVLYLCMFILGLVDSSLFGMLPNDLGAIDQTLHLGGGIASIAIASLLSGRNKLAV